MNELGQGFTASRPFQRPPEQIVAQIASSIARLARRCEPRFCRGYKPRERCIACQRRRCTFFDNAVQGALAACVGEYHGKRVARPCLDTQSASAACNAEHQHDIGLLREELGQFAINSRVAGGEHVNSAVDVRKRRPPPERQRPGKDRTRIERRAGEGTKAGDQNKHYSEPEHPGDLLNGGGRRQPAGGDIGLQLRDGGFDRAIGP